jgi:hypothetical protein
MSHCVIGTVCVAETSAECSLTGRRFESYGVRSFLWQRHIFENFRGQIFFKKSDISKGSQYR